MNASASASSAAAGEAAGVHWTFHTPPEEVRTQRGAAALVEVRNRQAAVLVGAHSHTAVDSGRPLRDRTTGPGVLEAGEGLRPIEAGATAPATTLQVAASSAAPRDPALPVAVRTKEVRTDVAPGVQAGEQDAALGSEIRE